MEGSSCKLNNGGMRRLGFHPEPRLLAPLRGFALLERWWGGHVPAGGVLKSDLSFLQGGVLG